MYPRLKGFKNIKSYVGGWIFFLSVSLLIMYWLAGGSNPRYPGDS